MENITARARIIDVDVAAELATATRQQILAESGLALAAQENQSAALDLELLA